MKLSIVIPVYNEVRTILPLIERVKRTNFDKEIIIVDDFSEDGTRQLLCAIGDKNIKVFMHSRNMGKGAALITGFKHATGDILIIQDADLEYDPGDYGKLIKPIVTGDCLVVYGSRFLTYNYSSLKQHLFYITHFLGNKFLNFLTCVLFRTKITDMETCYKAISRDVLRRLHLSARRFDIEPEITAQLLNMKIKITEVPISYTPRDYKQGKKISWRDGLAAMFILLKYRVRGRR